MICTIFIIWIEIPYGYPLCLKMDNDIERLTGKDMIP